MRIIWNDSLDPYFNMAAEEYVLTELSENVAMIWQNEKAVVIGVHQNAYAEVNLPFAKRENVAVVRRLTGGGAVFHDRGNVNYTIVENEKEKNNFLNYEYFCAPMIQFLNTLGFDARLSGRNDIVADGFKVSGSAEVKKNGRIMHHGTLLFDGNLELLSNVLTPNKLKFVGKGISSVKSRVKNLKQLKKLDFSVDEFTQKVIQCFDGERKDFSQKEIAQIEKIKAQKYALDEWNLGKNSCFKFSKEQKFDFGIVQLLFDLDDNIMKNVKICGDFFGEKDVSKLENKLCETIYDEAEVKKALENENVGQYVFGMTKKDLLFLFFGEQHEL